MKAFNSFCIKLEFGMSLRHIIDGTLVCSCCAVRGSRYPRLVRKYQYVPHNLIFIFQMLCPTLFLAFLAFASCDVSHLLQEQHLPYETTTSEQPPPRPYVFSYTAGRYPGHTDRQHTEVSDGSGVVRGMFFF